MEMNRDGAEAALERGRAHERSGDLHQALRFFKKAHAMYPSPETETLIARTETKLAHGNATRSSSTSSCSSNSSSSSSSSSRSHKQSQSSPSVDTRAFTPEQHSEAQRIMEIARKNKKYSYYEILNISRDAKEKDIDRAYKKLALRLHPDKNPSPLAIEAFKVVTEAHKCLSNTEGRAAYDLYGRSASAIQAESAAQRSHYARDINMDIFAELFGRPGGARYYYTNGDPRMHAHMFRRRHPQAQESSASGDSALGALSNLLPFLFLLMLLALMTMSGREDPIYSPTRTGDYVVERVTPGGVSYYVKTSFNNGDRSTINRLESYVESQWVEFKQKQCYSERLRQRQRSGFGGLFGGGGSNNEHEQRTPACEQLHEYYQRNNLSVH